MRPTDDILKGFVVDYEKTVERIYTKFAGRMVESSPGLEVLRHCTGVSTNEKIAKRTLPSWVPDWSRRRHEVPLPKRDGDAHDIIPWWAVPPLTQEDESVARTMFPMTYELAEKQSQEVLEGRKMVNDPQQWIKYYPREMVDELQSMVNTGKLLFAGIHDEHYIDPNANLDMHQIIEHTAKANEKLARFSFIRNWLDEDQPKRPVYAAGIGPKSTPVADEDMGTALVEGIIWDEIDILHAPFPEDLYSHWERSTEFIVAVGQCKQLALDSRRINSPYPSKEAEHAAFWNTLVVGQEVDSVSNFESCLPKVPKTRTRTEAPVTFRNPKQADQAERQDLLSTRTQELKDILGSSMRGPLLLADLPPLAASDEELQELKTSFQKLANMWSLQPYDLYHRPFSLPSVVPDPYWESRRQFDDKALEESTRSRRYKWENGLHTPDRNQSARLQKLAFEVYGEVPSIISQLQSEENDFQLEKYALGRRFFITKKGYMGLAPIGAQTGDDVVVLFGSHVPFILRGRGSGHYEVVGETYVSGIMKGEVLKDFDEGNCVAKGFVLA
ncbi:Heterokaryon incompatibility protein 6, OR allele [Colletotrichum aenigma]|uniref:Heterokaryon incompatibility protein 6, OR allele n=1 Tax=Colletotrichum aenigma TaxID=1215731 RepID=UPI00187253F8|nr:Heterokaryon incompatibility protein 6, OR allele [Colletotrichum aenigma]KAF5523356.1 Heterokaryon incompatibility protein 6, OR allele [Colletotrichum aenigma]